MQREVASRGEGGGHTALLYSHRYRGGISIAALQRWERKEGGRETERGEHHISAMLSQHVNVMHVLIEFEIFRGHVLTGSSALKLSPERSCEQVCAESSGCGLCSVGGRHGWDG